MAEVLNNVDIGKAGSNVLVETLEDGSERFNEPVFNAIGREVSEADNFILVTSGAITAGMLETGTKIRPEPATQMSQLQRLASIGHLPLLNRWQGSIPDKRVGNLLLTEPDLEGGSEREEALEVIYALLSAKEPEIPVINANDPITHEEIAFDGNDMLAAFLVTAIARSALFDGDIRLFLMTDVNGVYKNVKDPETRIPIIKDTAAYRDIAGGAGTPGGTGGMRKKFDAVDMVKPLGVDTWIYDPRDGNRELAVEGEIGTYFPAS